MTIKHMKIFVTVYEKSNITKAAEQLHMTQPAVSRAIHEIENYYNVRLFERIGKKLIVTESGKYFYENSIKILSNFNIMEKQLLSWNKDNSLRLGSTISLGTFLVPKLIKNFNETCPNVNTTLKIYNGQTIIENIKNDHIDLGLIEIYPEFSYISGEAIGNDCLSLIISPNNPLAKIDYLTVKDLKKYPFLTREKGSTIRKLIDDYFEKNKIELNIVWESISNEAIINGVIQNIGISILPNNIIKPYLDSNSIIKKTVHDMNLFRTHYIIWHKDKYITSAMKSFIELSKNFQTKN